MGVYECELRAICVLRAPQATMRAIKNECLLRRLALLVTSLSESECVGLDDLKLGPCACFRGGVPTGQPQVAWKIPWQGVRQVPQELPEGSMNVRLGSKNALVGTFGWVLRTLRLGSELSFFQPS